MTTREIQKTLIIAILLILAQISILYLYGQPPICKCGYIKLWEGDVFSSGNSQHLTDWYTFTHIIHGFLFYLITKIFFPRSSVGLRFLLALSVEVSWELLENSPMVIHYYRQEALAHGYSGDSILNSVSDSLSMTVGFWLAWRLPVWAIILIGVTLEIWLAYEIRDNLTLNIVNLIYLSPTIKAWQGG